MSGSVSARGVWSILGLLDLAWRLGAALAVPIRLPVGLACPLAFAFPFPGPSAGPGAFSSLCGALSSPGGPVRGSGRAVSTLPPTTDSATVGCCSEAACELAGCVRGCRTEWRSERTLPGSVATIVVVVAAATASAATLTPVLPARTPLIAAASPPRSSV